MIRGSDNFGGRRDQARLDFIVAGFPKAGTTTLLYAFLKHNETAIAAKEFCGLNQAIDSKIRMQHLNEVLNAMPSSDDLPVKHGIKCPMAIWDTRGIQLVSSNYKYVKLIVSSFIYGHFCLYIHQLMTHHTLPSSFTVRLA
jgi:hypothetical protein